MRRLHLGLEDHLLTVAWLKSSHSADQYKRVACDSQLLIAVDKNQSRCSSSCRLLFPHPAVLHAALVPTRTGHAGASLPSGRGDHHVDSPWRHARACRHREPRRALLLPSGQQRLSRILASTRPGCVRVSHPSQDTALGPWTRRRPGLSMGIRAVRSCAG
jgi:hypothetical protein